MGALRGINLIPFAPGPEGTPASPVEVVANLFFEISQYALAIGRSDVTDVMVNIAGGIAGFGLLALARSRPQGRAVAVVRRACLIGTVLAALVCGIFFVSPLHYAQREVAGIAGQAP